MGHPPGDTLVDLIDQVVATDGDREAFVAPQPASDKCRVTFAEWAAHADGLADTLHRDHGVDRGDVVAIELGSSIEYAIAYQAIVRLGAIATGINPRLGQAEREHIASIAQPRLTICGELPDYRLGDPQRRRPQTVGVTATDPVAIVWTGGTTGLPKGAWFDHACLAAMALGASPLSEPGDRRISPLPFAHVGYMTRMWDELTHRITTLIVPSPWNPAVALDLIAGESATVCQGVPTQYRMMFDHPDFARTDVSSLRLAGIGASRIPPELVVEMGDKLGCPVVVRYASTETSLATGTRIGDPVETLCDTVGRPNGAVQVRIADDADQPLTNGAVANVQVRSRAAMRGYWNNPDQTAGALTPDGWVRTGDLGRIDGAGNLRLAGRSTDMYVRGGYNVYPIEVENCLGDHPDIVTTAVLGTPVDDRLGEIGVLFAVARPGHQPGVDHVRSFVKERLADYKAPDVMVIVDELPLTSIGKVAKTALVDQARRAAATWSR